ncbi:MAG: hypothetical protein E6K78_09240 [Candidatus Eisenbacteria bacterium]|uniref:Uncharacterized protein n=1 Tax=Eiseniibacteriota bacterium TaxID=2212470 RepID=A0A538TL92_UNCEI|nr:MAG: hypothetical protein E6K78_09240 [Candidatus Eisenbacteria bacterium]
MLETLLKSVFGSKHDREVKRVGPIVGQINQLVASLPSLSDERLAAKSVEFKARLAEVLKDVDDPAERKRVETRSRWSRRPAGGSVARPGTWWGSRSPGTWSPTTSS